MTIPSSTTLKAKDCTEVPRRNGVGPPPSIARRRCPSDMSHCSLTPTGYAILTSLFATLTSMRRATGCLTRNTHTGHSFRLREDRNAMDVKSSVFAGLLEREDLSSRQDERNSNHGGKLRRICSPNGIWREKVVQWCYDVADHLDEDRSIVYVAMNILDRYCSAVVSTNPMNETMYEIASLSSIFLAVRIAGSRELLLDELVSMSRGGITMQDIIAMGNSIVGALSWDHSILTPIDFVQALFQLQSSLATSSSRQVVLDTASYLLELAVCDAFFSQFKASRLAVVALLCSLETNLKSEIAAFEEIVSTATCISLESNDTIVLCTRLQSIYSRSVENLNQSSGPHIVENDDVDDGEIPTRSVAFGVETVDGPPCHFSPKRDFCAFIEDDTIVAVHKRNKIDNTL